MDRKKYLIFICCFLSFAFVLCSCTDSSVYNNTPSDTFSYTVPNYYFETLPPIPSFDFSYTPFPTIPEIALEEKIEKQTTIPTQATKIEVVSYSETVRRNETASVTIKGNPNTRYSITVVYSSGPSEADGLYSKISDSYGYVTWYWHVGGRTAFGTYPITVNGGDDSKTIYFSVVL